MKCLLNIAGFVANVVRPVRAMRIIMAWMLALAVGATMADALQAATQLKELGPEDMIAQQDEAVLQKSTTVLLDKMNKVVAPTAPSVVAFMADNKLVAMGTVIAPGVVVTKLSEYELAKRKFSVVLTDVGKNVYDYRCLVVMREHDLMVVAAPGLKAPAVKLDRCKEVEVGDMVMSVSPLGEALDCGIVSVAERSLRDEDVPYLGIATDPGWTNGGVKVVGVEAGAGGHKSGLLAGDVILKINGKDVVGATGVRVAMTGIKPEEAFPVLIERDGKSVAMDMIATKRPTPARRKVPRRILETMDSMGNPRSVRRDGFPAVIQTDMPIPPEFTGCPVVDLEGKVVGIALSRAGRVETYVLPVWVCRSIINNLLPKLGLAIGED